MKTLTHLSILILICLLGAACAPAQSVINDPATGPAAWIDAPLDGSSLPLAEYQLVSHASDASGITSFELSVDGSVLKSDPVAADQAGNAIVHISQSWQPAKPGVYMLSVRAANQAGVYGPYAYARVTIGRVAAATASPLPTETAMATASPTPLPTATVTLTPTPSGPVAIGLVNTNCHDGPGTAFRSRDVLMQGQTASINGISEDLNWVRVQRLDGSRNFCWLSISVIQITGGLEGLHTYVVPTIPPEVVPERTRSVPTVAPTITLPPHQ